MIDESIMEKIIPLPDEDEEMEKVQGELEGEGFPITNFKKGGIFYHLCRMLVTIYIELKELARTIVNGCFIKHAEGDWLKIKAADYSKQQKEAKAARGEMNTLYRDSIIQVLSTKIDNYRKTDILQPSDDMVLEQDKVIMAGDINVTVRNVVQSARGKE